MCANEAENVSETTGKQDGEQPMLSIIYSNYNRMWAIPEAIESARDCSYPVEIIVADDGSDDGSFEWCQEQPDVIAFRSPGYGQTWCNNAGLDRATGKYVRICDSDDWIVAGANDRQIKVAEETGADIVVGASEWRDGDKNLIEVRAPRDDDDDFFAMYLREMPVPHYSSHIVRREFLGDTRFLQPFQAGLFAVQDDLRYMLELGLKEPKAVFERGVTAAGIRHHTNERMMFQKGVMNTGAMLTFITHYNRVLSRAMKRGLMNDKRRRAAAYFIWRLADWIARTGYIEDADDLARWAKDMHPEVEPSYTPGIKKMVSILGFKRAMRLLHWRRNVKNFLFPAPHQARKYPIPDEQLEI